MIILSEYSEFIQPLPARIEYTITDDAASVVCSVRANPDSEITWYKDGNTITADGVYFRTETTVTGRNTTSVLRWQGIDVIYANTGCHRHKFSTCPVG